MKFLDLVKARTSCRKFSSKPVEVKSIERCLEAARLAPSACNAQPWHFIVVQDPTLKAGLAREAFSGIYSPLSVFAQQAPVLVVLVRETSKYLTKIGGFLRGIEYSLIDIGIAGEHFVLAATEEGLGTCWIGWFDEKKTKKVLNIPREQKVDIIFSVGHPAEPFTTPRPRKTLGEMSEIR